MWWLWMLVLAAAGAGAGAAAGAGAGKARAAARAAGGGFAFYRSLHAGAGTRRVFGGAPAGEWAPACALLDRSLTAVCSGAVLAPRWALTAAHCARPNIGFVRYNGRSSDDDLAAVDLLYVHPDYAVEQRDEGTGMDVVLLHHDVGLARTRRDMLLAAPPAARRAPRAADPLALLAPYDVSDVMGKEIEMLGYGRSERAGAGAALRAAWLRAAGCPRGAAAWRHCGCAVGNATGVCSGDSGGPVLYMGRQIGVTSMGPLRCAGAAGAAAPALSVFTALRPYAALINATVRGGAKAARMRPVPARAPRCSLLPPLLLPLLPLLLPTR